MTTTDHDKKNGKTLPIYIVHSASLIDTLVPSSTDFAKYGEQNKGENIREVPCEILYDSTSCHTVT